jgi:hypothetical protein
MYLFLDSFWRAVLYCVRPRVIWLSLLPLLTMVVLSMTLGYFYWDAALDQVRAWMATFPYAESISQWLDGVGMGKLASVLPQLLVVFVVTPLIVVFSMLAVALLMTPRLVNLVAANRFADLEAKAGGGVLAGLVWSLASVLMAGVAMVISLPLWLLPPLIFLVPPLIWGWLTYRVMAYDALATHASQDERRALFKQHGGWLLLMGVVCGYLGSAPSVVWAMGAGFAPAFVLLLPVAIWVYTLVFAFASLWFTHYCLGALKRMRQPGGSPAAAHTVLQSPEPLLPEPSNPAPPLLHLKDAQ